MSSFLNLEIVALDPAREGAFAREFSIVDKTHLSAHFVQQGEAGDAMVSQIVNDLGFICGWLVLVRGV